LHQPAYLQHIEPAGPRGARSKVLPGADATEEQLVVAVAAVAYIRPDLRIRAQRNGFE
jgi:hypothetical protein